MLVEIPDLDVIMTGVVAFLIGLFGLYLYYKIKPFVNFQQKTIEPAHMERLEYYERQLIDMKIRLDALNVDEQSTQIPQGSTVASEDVIKQVNNEVITTPPTTASESTPNSTYGDVTSHVLKLITNKAMTSRDIQITIGKTREHTSRLMKKLYEDGFVERNASSKPYTYSITDKGRSKIGLLESSPIAN